MRRWEIHGSLALLTLVWGTTFAAIRIGLDGVPPFFGVALRFGLAAALVFLLGRALGAKLGDPRKMYPLWIANAFLTFSIPYGVTYWAEQSLPSGLTAVLFSTFPLFVALLAHRFLPGERFTRSSVAGVLVGFLGVAVIYSEDLGRIGTPETRTAALVFLIAPVASSIGQILVKRFGKGISPFSLTAPPMAMTALLLGVVSAAVEKGHGLETTVASIGSLTYLVVAGSALTFLVYFRVLEQVSATRLSLITYVIPIVAVVVGVVGLGEAFTPRLLVGSTLVIVGVGIALRRRSRPA